MTDKSVIITREDLYRRLWEVPFKQIIEEYGTTYNILRTVANELNVPRPSKGYWKKYAAGTAVDPPPLPELEPGQPRSRKLERRDFISQAAVERRRSIESLLGEIRVPTLLTRPHLLVAGWIAERRARHRCAMKQSTLAPSFYEPSDTDRRRHCIMQALLPALERQGAEILAGSDEQTVEARFAGAVVPFRLREKLKQVRHLLTEEERRRSWMGASKFTLELHPSGNLSFRIETYNPLGGTWEDTDQSRLEDHVMDITIAILMARDCAIEAKRQAQEQLERQQERERQKRLDADAVRLEEDRWATFMDLSRRSDEAAHLRRFFARIEAAGLPPGEEHGGRTVAEWQAWMRMRIDQTDPLTDGVGGVFQLLAHHGP